MRRKPSAAAKSGRDRSGVRGFRVKQRKFWKIDERQKQRVLYCSRFGGRSKTI